MKTLLGTKLGMTQIFDDDAQAIPITVCQLGPCQVTQIKTSETDGYDAVQLSFGLKKTKQVNQATAGHFQKSGVSPSQRITEIRVDNPEDFELGQTVRVEEVFSEGNKADVTSISKGKGFSGVMKRHNFAGLSASHGTHRKHRSPGAIGACTYPARVFRGMKMGGRMGGERVTTLNLDIVKIDPEQNLIFLRGAVPGPKGAAVMVRHAVKRPVTA